MLNMYHSLETLKVDLKTILCSFSKSYFSLIQEAINVISIYYSTLFWIK